MPIDYAIYELTWITRYIWTNVCQLQKTWPPPSSRVKTYMVEDPAKQGPWIAAQ